MLHLGAAERTDWVATAVMVKVGKVGIKATAGRQPVTLGYELIQHLEAPRIEDHHTTTRTLALSFLSFVFVSWSLTSLAQAKGFSFHRISNIRGLIRTWTCEMPMFLHSRVSSRAKI